MRDGAGNLWSLAFCTDTSDRYLFVNGAIFHQASVFCVSWCHVSYRVIAVMSVVVRTLECVAVVRSLSHDNPPLVRT